MSTAEKPKNTLNYKIGQLVYFAEAAMIDRFYHALQGIIAHKDEDHVRDVIDLSAAFLKERDTAAFLTIQHRLSKEMTGTQTLPADSRTVKPDAESRTVAAQKDKKAFQISTAEKRTLRIAKELIKRTQNKGTKGLIRTQYRELFTDEAHQELKNKNFSSAIRCINMAFQIENPSKLKNPTLYKPLINTLINITRASMETDIVSGQNFNSALNALTTALKITPQKDLDIRNSIADEAIKVAEQANQHNRHKLAAELESFVHKTVPEHELNGDDVSTNAKNWELEVRELSKSNLDRAQRKAKGMLANDGLDSSSPLQGAAKRLVNEFGATINQVKQKVRPIKPERFAGHFEKRVLKV